MAPICTKAIRYGSPGDNERAAPASRNLTVGYQQTTQKPKKREGGGWMGNNSECG